MNAKKKVMLALFVVTIFVGGFLVARGYPDWALNVIQKEGTTFVVTGSVDANITNTEINAYVTNTTITIEPSTAAEFVVKPAEAVVFQIQGSVDANITNTELNVNVTNSEITIKPASGTVFTISPDSAAVFNVQGSVDANITNSELDVHVTNSTITITPEAGAVFEIKPAAETVFNIQGSVDANITNTELNVNVTNSVLDVSVQGTANVEIQNAQLNVKTLREQASEAENITYARDFLDLDSHVVQGKIIYKNEGNTTVYLEAVYAAIDNSDTYDPACFISVSILDPDGYTVAEFYANPPNFPLNFDPAVPIPPGYSVEVYAYRWVDYGYTVSVSLLIRTA